MPQYALVYVTAGDTSEAQRLATMLLTKKLVACVNIHGPVTSLYRWKGKLETSEEFALMAKTRKPLVSAVIAAIKKAHSYECPCIVALPITSGHPPFLRWIDDETRAATPRPRRARVKR